MQRVSVDGSTSATGSGARPSNDQLWGDIGELLARTKTDFDPTTSSARAEWEASRSTAAAAA